MCLDQADKPNSVVGDHLSGPAITDELERHSPKGTALHAGKDLVVAPLSFGRILPEGSLGLSPLTSLWSPLSSRTTGVTRYLSTCSFLEKGRVHVRTFLPALS